VISSLLLSKVWWSGETHAPPCTGHAQAGQARQLLANAIYGCQTPRSASSSRPGTASDGCVLSSDPLISTMARIANAANQLLAAHHCAAGQTTLSSTLSSADSKRTRRRHLRRRQSAGVAIKRFCRRSMMFKTSTKSNIGSTRSWATAWGFYPRHVKTLRRDDKYRIDDYFS
jgi:hypothetical protein